MGSHQSRCAWHNKVMGAQNDSIKRCMSEYEWVWLTWWNSRCLAIDGSSKSGHSSPTSSKLSSVSTSSPGAWRLCVYSGWEQNGREEGKSWCGCLFVICATFYSTLTLSLERMAWWRNQTVQLNFYFHQDEDLWPGTRVAHWWWTNCSHTLVVAMNHLRTVPLTDPLINFPMPDFCRLSIHNIY